MFLKIDYDNDGFISKEELIKVVQETYLSDFFDGLNDEYSFDGPDVGSIVEKMIKASNLDENGDRINYHDFLIATLDHK